MSLKKVLIVRTGVANTASVQAALARAGCETSLSENPAEIVEAESLVLPGVGTFGATMERLNVCGLAEPLRERIQQRKQTLAVCVGLQVLFERSEESPGVEGLGIFPGIVQRFPSCVRIPQFGWNWIDGGSSLQSGYAYFANSYCVGNCSTIDEIAWSEHGVRFIAAFRHHALTACQFHPELSGELGKKLFADWIGSAAC